MHKFMVGILFFEMDVWYTENVSFLLDVQIVISTIGVAVSRKNISSETAATMEEFLGSEATAR